MKDELSVTKFNDASNLPVPGGRNHCYRYQRFGTNTLHV